MSYNFKYADLLDDDVFKLVFGRESSKDVMIEFLNQVIPEKKIIDLIFMDKEMHPLERGTRVLFMTCSAKQMTVHRLLSRSREGSSHVTRKE